MKEHSLSTVSYDCLIRNIEHSPASNQLDKLLNFYLVACKVEGKSAATIDTYHRRVGGFVSFCLHENLLIAPAINPQIIRAFLLSLQEKGCSNNTVNAYYRAIQTFFNWLVNEAYITSTPMKTLKPPRLEKKVIRPFTNEDIRRLLSTNAKTDFLSLRNRALILLFLDTGLRLAEVSGIKISDIDFDQETICVFGKGSKERVVRVGKQTQKALLKYLLSRNDNYPGLWLTEEHRPLTIRGVQEAIKKLCYRANIIDAKPGPHTFRHTAAINYLRNGGDEFTLQIMLGHTTLAMTRRYTSTLGTEDMLRVHRQVSPVDNLKL
ncbi:MAG: tyrosine-type recombinase/integrase [Dehalococcoides mccartyi]|uniref:Tyrosine-type recombinase/integrase n=1 Tax=Dehalococcoides mccartyi TaxID=61435 RepID=A0AB38Z7W8_9CHLR|nr:tyrosine-type recombinase/integrase [Dehalococcoides mccartyi]MDP4279309.1 tyrosine-type recombinase/integrase [Dehalococcoides mccartyi]WRO06675.1 tyrosine-type recombinase/integrase [Dehalococcoides mccartyi]